MSTTKKSTSSKKAKGARKSNKQLKAKKLSNKDLAKTLGQYPDVEEAIKKWTKYLEDYFLFRSPSYYVNKSRKIPFKF